MNPSSEPSSDALENERTLVDAPLLKVTCGTIGGCPCYVFHGTCATMSQSLREDLTRLIQEKTTLATDLLVDVTGLQYANSTLVGILSVLFMRAVDASRRFVLVGAQPQVVDLLDVIGILPNMEQAPTRGDALELLRYPRR